LAPLPALVPVEAAALAVASVGELAGALDAADAAAPDDAAGVAAVPPPQAATIDATRRAPIAAVGNVDARGRARSPRRDAGR
jgi:hypothetical protein